MADQYNPLQPVYCVHCGAQNPGDAKTCVSCGLILVMPQGSQQPQGPGTPPPPSARPPVQTKTSGLAIAAFVLGLLSVVGGLTAIPAIILGIIALVAIERSGGRLTGIAFAVIGIVIPVFACIMMVGILMPALARVRLLAFRMTCGTNLSGIGRAMMVYAGDYDDKLPRAGGRNATWGTTQWNALTRDAAYVDNGTTSMASISSCYYLLVKYTGVTPKSFVCKGDTGTTEFQLSQETCPPGFDLIDAWDFGSEPMTHCSYSYHIPFSQFALSISSNPRMAIASDRNPWLDSPGAEAKTAVEFASFIPDTYELGGDNQTAIIGNAITHQGDGQNVLFMDTHVEFAKRPFVGLDDDNIFTRSSFSDAGDPKGEMPGMALPSVVGVLGIKSPHGRGRF